LNKFIPKPYKLFNKIQHYEWGTKNENAFIPQFLDIRAQKDIPYAELWIGAHPKAPSEVEFYGKRISLNKLIKEFPEECLGNCVSNKFSNQFPFLLKVLSAGKALSIQTHPNKQQAEKLHGEDPKNYPDDHHKPEIAIAIDSLDAIAGFRPINEIIKNLKELVELKKFTGEEIIEKILSSKDEKEIKKFINELYSTVMKKADEKVELSNCMNEIQKRLQDKESLTVEEEQFLQQYKLFGADIGLLSFFFFNIIHLKTGQAIFTDAGVPHAYMKGNIIECMANSDNVVRAGLTNKFKDVKTLLEIVKYEFDNFQIINAEQREDEIIYKTKAEEFEVSAYKKKIGFNRKIMNNNKPSVYLIINGEMDVRWTYEGKNYKEEFSKGEALLIPACLDEYEIFVTGEANYIVVKIPE
jgi:mannose-6-phosphate isomerase